MDKGTLLYQVTTIKSHGKSSAHFLTSNISRLTFQNRPIALVTLVEINDPWNPAREAGQAIVDSVNREFIKSSGNSLLGRFEQVLKATNSVVERAQEKIDKFINVATIIVDGQQVHFSTIGNTKIILHRSGRLADVSSEQSDASTRFSAVTSGDLTTKDTLFVATQALAKLIKAAGKDAWQEDVIDYLDKLMADTNEEERAVIEGFALKYSPENPSNETYLSTPEKTTKSRPSLPVIKISLSRINWPGIAKKILAAVKKVHFKLPNTVIPELPAMPKAPRITKNLGFVRKLITNKITYLAVMIIIVGASLYTIIERSKHTEPEVKATTALDTLGTQTSQTIFDYLNAETTLASYNDLSQDEKNAFAEKLKGFGPEILTATSLKSEIGNPIVQIDALGTDIYLLDNAGQLYRWNGNVMAQVQQATKIVKAVSFVVFSADKIVVSDESGGIWLLDNTVESPKNLAVPGNIPAGKRILGKYSNNLYIFSSNGAVYRFTAFATELTGPALVTKTGTLPFVGIRDWQIIGDFVAISDGGLVESWSKNTLRTGSFTATNLEDKAAIYTDTAKNTYLASGQLLSIYALGGSRTKTYFIAEKDAITDIARDDSGNWYLAIGQKLVAVTL